VALGKSWRPRSIELPFKYNKVIAQSGYLGAENVYFDRRFSAIEVPLEALSAKIKLLLIGHPGRGCCLNGGYVDHS
jgi:hypothetical protein